jgi:predicted glycosyltransferase
MEQILAARELDRDNDFPIVMVLGPFMKSDSRERIRLRASRLPNVTVLDFESQMEVLIRNSAAIIGMCGYNTFCEAMSFNKRVLFVPRVTPREEQLIRARRASELGLCEMLLPEEAATPSLLARKLRELPSIDKPSKNLKREDMAGFEAICEDVAKLCRTPNSRAEKARMKLAASRA